MAVKQTLDSRYQFENYVTGKSNQSAHAAAINVADSLRSACNPLYIFGGVGVGKTHLLQAIGNKLKKESCQTKIFYIHATRYALGAVRAFQNKQLDKFRQRFDSLDLLLIDDIMLIADKPGTQQELFYLLESLITSSKQVVITSDAHPEDILGFEPRLISRFCRGLTVAIEPPDLEMRAAILLQKAIVSGNPIEEDVACFVAKHVRSDVRTLEGALNSIDAYARFHKRAITIELVNEAIFTSRFSKEPDEKLEASPAS